MSDLMQGVYKNATGEIEFKHISTGSKFDLFEILIDGVAYPIELEPTNTRYGVNDDIQAYFDYFVRGEDLSGIITACFHYKNKTITLDMNMVSLKGQQLRGSFICQKPRKEN